MNQNSLLRHMRQILKSFITKYFDGNAHAFGLSAPEFPEVNLIFGRPQLSDQEFEENDIGEQEELPNINIVFAPASQSGFKARKTTNHSTVIQSLFFYVYTNDTKDDWTDNDNIQNLLGVIFYGAGHELASSGMKVVSIEQPHSIEYGPEHNIQVSQRAIEVRYELDYERAE